MTDTVNLPVAGPVKKQWLLIGGAAAAGVVGYAWWRHYRAGADGAATAAELDPAYADYQSGLYTGGAGTTTPGIAYTPPGNDVDPNDLPPTTNAAWTTRGVDYLQNLGFDPQLVAVTLGKYLAKVPLTQAEADIVRTVEGAIGKPPIGEFRIIMVGSPPAGGGGGEPTVPETASVPANYNIYQWCYEISQAYRITYDLNRMRALNPGIDQGIKWGPQRDASGNLVPVFPQGRTVKIR